MRNTLGDLNNHLFAQLERLGDEDLETEELKVEIERSKSIATVAARIIDNASLVLQAKKVTDGAYDARLELPRMLEG